MSVHVEVWPVAADEVGLWLLSGDDAWRSGPVMADDEPHSEVEYALSHHAASDHVELLHSTSWRVDGPIVVLTYMAVIGIPGLARDSWPTARPISLELANAVGKPLSYQPTEPPTPRYVDVLFHGLRHLRFLLDTDAANGAALDDYWRRHLAALNPALATMYNQDRRWPRWHHVTPRSVAEFGLS
jgi:hypothetical protein